MINNFKPQLACLKHFSKVCYVFPKHRLDLYAMQRLTSQVALDKQKAIKISALNIKAIYPINLVRFNS